MLSRVRAFVRAFVRSSVRACVVRILCVRSCACACARARVCVRARMRERVCVCGWLPPERRMILLSSGVEGSDPPPGEHNN